MWIRRLVSAALLFSRSKGHVPTYQSSNCKDGCCTPPHHHATSQSVYIQGSGGIEIHVVGPIDPFDTLKGEILHFDAVFSREYDTTTFSLHVGCGGCAKDDERVPSARRLVQWQKGQLEPFTQTAYYSAFPSENRTLNATLLSAENCPQAHFTVHAIDYNNRTDQEPLIWSAVVGMGESFTALELLSFPTYIVNNHGYAWNQLIKAFALIVLLVGGVFLALFYEFKVYSRLDSTHGWRDLMHLLSCSGFGIAFFDEGVNLIYAQFAIDVDGMLWLSLFLVLIGAQMIPFLVVWNLWNRSLLNKFRGALVYIVVGILLLFFFGSGYYIGPCCLIVLGLLYFYDAIRELLKGEDTKMKPDTHLHVALPTMLLYKAVIT